MTIYSEIIAWYARQQNWTGENGLVPRTVEHLGLTAAAVGIACVIGLPLALWLGHTGRGGALAVNVANVGRAVPTFAALALLSLLFSSGGRLAPTLIALVLFAVPPVLANAYVGIREVDRDTVEAARGMGMSGWQVLSRVELPLATPLVMNGVRQCATQVVATATIAALVAGPGLGRIVTAGYTRQDYAQVIAGALAVAVLALLVEALFAVLERQLDPVARVRGRSRPAARAVRAARRTDADASPAGA